jgi:hypothetical protein
MMPRKLKADWTRPLTRSLTINRNGQKTKLATLSDARQFLLDNFAGTINDRPLEHAIDCLFKAAQGPDDFRSAKQATDAVARVIEGRGWS